VATVEKLVRIDRCGFRTATRCARVAGGTLV